MNWLDRQDRFQAPEPRRKSRRLPVILIIERRILMQSCVLRLLKRELARFHIIGTTSTGDLDRAAGQDVRLVAVDIEMSSFSDPAVASGFAAIRARFPQVPVVVIADRDDDGTAQEALQWGARGFFPSTIPIDVVIAGFRLVLAGGVYCPPFAAPPGDQRAPERPPALPMHPQERVAQDDVDAEETRSGIALTPRETDVIAELQLGRSNKVIALNLGMSENTVKMHVQHLMRKLGARTRTEAVFIWARGSAAHDHPGWATARSTG
jgi:DNA-binding NarL/FixJ family response regulator